MIGRLLALILGSSAGAEEAAVTNVEQHDATYKRGVLLIAPCMQLLERRPKVTKKARRQARHGIALLDAVTDYNPQNWSAFWTKGKAYQFLGEHRLANAEFRASFSVEQHNPDVAREYALSQGIRAFVPPTGGGGRSGESNRARDPVEAR
jgi:hypothetical protein